MDNWPKAVTTASIWVAVGFALGHGLFRMNFSGRGAPELLVYLTLILVGAATLGTLLIWRSKSGNGKPGQD